MPTNINTTTSTPNWEIKLQTSLQKAGFNSQERQDKIIANIANELHKKGTTNPIEKDIFEAANKVYKFNKTTNLELAKAIDGFDGFDGNIVLSGSKAQWTDAGAVSNKDEREQPDDSRNIIDRSIARIKAKNGTKEITVNDIIKDLKEKNVITVNQGKVTKNKHLHDNLVAMRDQGVTAKEIIKATNSNAEWDNLLGTVKKTEFQRELIQDSIKNIKKTDFTVDDIIKDLKGRNVIMVNSGEVTKNKHLHDNLVAMKDQAVGAEEIIKAAKTDTDWNKLIGTVKETEFQRALKHSALDCF